MEILAQMLNILFQSMLNIAVICTATFGITIIFKTSTTTNFAQGSIAAFSCYVTVSLMHSYFPPNLYWLAIIIGVVVGMAIGLFIDVGIFRRGRNVNLIGKQIITMGMVTLLVGIIPIVFGTNTLNQIPQFVKGNFVFSLGTHEVSIPLHGLVCFGIAAVVISGIFILLYKSKWGLGVRATASNEGTAGIIGINTFVITATSWAIAGGLAALAAIMLNANGGNISPLFMTKTQVNAFFAGILGGFSSFIGPVVGAIILPIAEQVIQTILVAFKVSNASDWGSVVVYGLLLVVVLIKPQGLFGKKILKKV